MYVLNTNIGITTPKNSAININITKLKIIYPNHNAIGNT